jgi:hypothetical protein
MNYENYGKFNGNAINTFTQGKYKYLLIRERIINFIIR